MFENGRNTDVRRERFTFCEVCGKKTPWSQIGGQCVSCNRRVCTNCTVLFGGRVYCVDHAPRPPPPPPTSSSGCFIATAAYGTPFASEIQVLRKFRDNGLDKNRIGRILIKKYYQISPPIGQKISVSETRRKIVRLMLTPLVEIFQRIE